MQPKKNIAGIITWLAAIVTGVIVIVFPLGYFFVSYQYMAASIETEAEINADIISQIIGVNTEYWEFEQDRLAEQLARRPGKGYAETRRIVNTKNEIIAENADKLKPPVIMRSSYLVDSGVVVGKLEINRSLQPILKQSVLIVLVSLFIGLGSFVILRIMPIRIIYRAEKALQNAYDELEIANEQLHREITERKRSEDLYKDLSESSLAAVFIVQDGKFRYINTSAIAYAGYSAEELIDRYSDIVVHPDDKELVKRKSMDMLAGRSNQAFEFRMVTKQNQIRWISQIVTPIEHEGRAAILGNAADVTDLRESRAKMEELMALESSILSSIPHVVLGLQNYNILFVNDVVESIFGWKPAEIIGKSVSVLYNSESEYENYARHMYADVKNQPTSSRGQEVTCRHKDGSNIICRVTCCGIGGVSGDNRVVATYEDITYSKMAHFQLFQSEKMASIGQLAAGVAHEINNPTAFVSSNLKTLSEYMDDIIMLIKGYRLLTEDLGKTANTESLREVSAEHLKLVADLEAKAEIDFIVEDIVNLIAESREGTGRIGRIVQNLKNFAHPGDEKLKMVNINDNIESTLNIVWNELKYKAIVCKEYGNIPDILGYPQQLNQVFMNILVNAAQSIKENGEIRISTRVVDGYAEIKFTDTGVGIPKENLPKIFDPFFTTKDVGKGTGLGLHVSYDIVNKHNGTIEIDSMVNAGTTVTVKIPLNCE